MDPILTAWLSIVSILTGYHTFRLHFKSSCTMEAQAEKETQKQEI